MKFFEDTVEQKTKDGHIVCGDNHLCYRTPDSTFFVLCDGIGSGVYANIAAITCANRMMELYKTGVSMRAMCEMVADSMHKAREEKIPFAAFTAVKILSDGLFTIYNYEAPDPIIIKDGLAINLNPVIHFAAYEALGETTGKLEYGDSLIIVSDGITQTGLGIGNSLGIGSDGLVEFINRRSSYKKDINLLPREIMDMSYRLSGHKFEDDSTVAILQCRQASQLAILTGPPASRSRDKEIINDFIKSPGPHVIAGSTTADIASRELNKEIKLLENKKTLNAPPEYMIDGMQLVSEGAIILNQVHNILDEAHCNEESASPAERLCAMMLKADIIRFFIGSVVNEAHDSMVFRQAGIRPRMQIIQLITEKLRNKGKLVVEKNIKPF